MESGRRFDAIDTRWVFIVYAAAACLLGLGFIVWGTPLVKLLGSFLIAAACAAAALAAVDDPRARRQGLFWFAGGHFVVYLALFIQRSALGLPGTDQAMWIPFVLFSVALNSEGNVGSGLYSIFSAPAKQLRSRYEQQIRQAAAQEERNRLARDLHDSVKQQLFAIQTAAAAVQARLDGDPAGAGEALEQVRSSAREAMTEMQSLTDQLRSGPLENTGLVEALKRHSEALGFRTGAQVTFRCEGNLPPSEDLPPGAHQALLRVAEEALSNVARHARARNVAVSLYAAPGRVEVQIKDDGAGFDPNQQSRGMGIANMSARAKEFRAEFELQSRPGGGTFVRFSIPYAVPETPRAYLTRAIVNAVSLVLISIWALGSRQYLILAMSMLLVLEVTRNAAAWRRARQRSEAAR